MDNLTNMGDREKTAVTALLEEYKARWQQLLNLDSEVNKWTASYVIALVIGISWVLGSERIKGLDELFSARNYDNTYFILSLALINAAYSLSLAFKGYQVQQISFYLHTVVGKDIVRLTGVPFNLWEVWRRASFCTAGRIGKSEWRRAVYYPIITLLPFAVSVSILWIYRRYAGTQLRWSDPHNIYFYCVVTINIIAASIAFSTIGFNTRWKQLTRKELEEGVLLFRKGEAAQRPVRESSPVENLLSLSDAVVESGEVCSPNTPDEESKG